MKTIELIHTLTKEKKEFTIFSAEEVGIATAIDNESKGHFVLSTDCYICHSTQSSRKDVFVDNIENPNIIVCEKVVLDKNKQPVEYNLENLINN